MLAEGIAFLCVCLFISYVIATEASDLGAKIEAYHFTRILSENLLSSLYNPITLMVVFYSMLRQ